MNFVAAAAPPGAGSQHIEATNYVRWLLPVATLGIATVDQLGTGVSPQAVHADQSDDE